MAEKEQSIVSAEQSSSIDPVAGDVFVDWEYPEYVRYQRTWRWYIGAAVAIGLLVLWSLYDNNQLFLIVIILAAVIFVIANSRTPESIYFAITEGGIVVKDRFLPFEDIRNFWMIYQPPHVKTLYFEPASLFSPRIQIHLTDQNPADIRDLLLQFLEEDLAKEEEPSSELWGRLLKL